jgi:hypothetical protein
MNKIIILGLLIITSSMSGCAESSKGAYSCTVDSGMLFLDGETYHLMTASGNGFFGTYSMEDGILFLDRIVLGTSESIVFKVNGTDLIDGDGDRWIRR